MTPRPRLVVAARRSPSMNNGAKRALVPVGKQRQVLELKLDVLEHLDPIFYGDVRQAAFKALGVD